MRTLYRSPNLQHQVPSLQKAVTKALERQRLRKAERSGLDSDQSPGPAVAAEPSQRPASASPPILIERETTKLGAKKRDLRERGSTAPGPTKRAPVSPSTSPSTKKVPKGPEATSTAHPAAVAEQTENTQTEEARTQDTQTKDKQAQDASQAKMPSRAPAVPETKSGTLPDAFQALLDSGTSAVNKPKAAPIDADQVEDDSRQDRPKSLRNWFSPGRDANPPPPPTSLPDD